ncbi:DUF3488 and transglutaminase-like domain-containing protein [Deefgea tanakiae]|uniref:DUF3488 and transglutaminase-like domain-containing protein n=1 Tax=Deefgea tanakiae TaxID=2865840 RepID=A0ABX8Z9W6_9NEIS|nr:DUF3488 and transglutaminase-like domain-containing protein [Deefgea tanakiae]QZA79372.1 DUF3488 and transglutaminase-like domain-containing protein [Deefgea tanakiae]
MKIKKTGRPLHPRELQHMGLLMGLVCFPHLLMQPGWLAAALSLCVIIFCSLTPLMRSKIPHWSSIVLAVISLGVVFQAHETLIGRDGGVAVLVALSIIKLYETRTLRDAHSMFLLTLFTTGVGFLQGQAPWQAAIALFTIFTIFAMALKLENPQLSMGISSKKSLRLLAEAIPVALILFVLFPRLPAPLWATPSEKVGLSGLSGEQMSPGSLSQLIQDDSIAFRAEFKSSAPSQDQLYWRGPVFDQFDGARWLPAKNTFGTPPTIVPLSAIVDYQITLEPHQQNWLLALDLPINAPSDSVLSRQLQLLRATPITQRLRYQASSTLNWQTLGEDGVAQALQLPEDINPKSRALAASWQNLAPAERVQAGLTWLKSNGFSYTLNPQLLRQRNRVDEFLFESKQGYCEHFSSSFAFLMRAANVPARVVTGYQGGLLNPSSNYYIVRQADAHAWIEVWLAGQGWQRVDPTFVISPSRIENGIGTSFQGAGLPMMLRSDNFWLKSVRLKLDVFVNTWNQWVIGYDDKRQLDLLKRLGIDDFLSLSFLLWLAGGILISLGGFALWLLLSNRPPALDMASRLYLRFCKKMAKHQLLKAPHETVLQFAQRCQSQRPAQSAAITEITQLYIQARYAQDPQALQQLKQAIARFT